MPVEDGNYEQLTEAEIRSGLETELRNEFGADIDLTESSVFSTLVNVLAATLSENQEQSLQDVYESAFLDTAMGEALDDVVSIIGIQRRDAVHATGVEQFDAGEPVTQDYLIQRGTRVQTDSDTPEVYETTEVTTLKLVDSFESGSLQNYSGDTGSAIITSDAAAPDGNNVLELAATNGAKIYNDDIEVQRGTQFHAWVNAGTDTAPTLLFGIQRDDPSTYYQVVVDDSVDEVRLEYVTNDTVDEVLDTLSTTDIDTTSYQEVAFNWAITGNIGVELYDANGNEVGTLGAEDDRLVNGFTGFKSSDATGTKRFDWYTTSAVSANIRALSGGVDGNVGSNAVRRLPSPPTGVDSATNLYPVGDSSYTNTDDEPFVVGADREADEELRNRAEDAVTGGGSATHDAIVAELVNNTAGVSSVTIFENKTDDDNTGTGGLPPHSFETVVFGGNDQDVAETIFDKKAITAHDYGGVNGTEVTESVRSDVNGQLYDITFSRPVEVSVSMSLDLVVDDSYVGDDDIRDDIVAYIGGQLSNGATTVGLGVGDNVRIDEIRDIVVGGDTGVIGMDQSVDGSPIETTPSYTTVDGLEVVDIGENEVAQATATDASITVNTREV